MQKNNKGFTLAELLMAIAILTALMGISFVAVNQYTKGLKLNELNWTAKEIFLASQNQLSKANAEGSLQTIEKKGYPLGNNEYYVTVNAGTPDSNCDDAWHKILPFGSIDDTVRMGGHYVIRYNLKSATVLQVYYSDDKNCVFSETDLTNTTFQTGGYSDDDRKHYSINGTTCVVGYYEGSTDALHFEEVGKPILKVENTDKLTAQITNYDTNWKAILCIKGLTSKQETTVDASSSDLIVLDDITNNKHFSQQFTGFIPGEDIEVYVTVQHKDSLSNVEESNHVIENSLFASKEVDENNKATVRISSFRHLENLDKRISNLAIAAGADEDAYTITTASQIDDLDWNKFNGFNSRIITFVSGTSPAKGVSYIPVNIDYSLTYAGKNRFIDGVQVDVSGAAGLFGQASNLKVSDLELRDFNIAGDGNTGALIGTGSNCTITNVLVYNPNPLNGTEPAATDTGLQIESRGGSAGGLIGTLIGSSQVNSSAAAVYVKAASSAGGLIGNMTGGTVKDSYAGGHTRDGQFTNDLTVGTVARVNVQGAKAGGLIGTMTNTTISYSYSTASVGGTTVHAFANSNTEINFDTNYAFGWEFPTGKDANRNPEMTENDLSANTVGEAVYYDDYWKEDVYPYRTITELDSTLPKAGQPWFLSQHVGDWAYPQITGYIINE